MRAKKMHWHLAILGPLLCLINFAYAEETLSEFSSDGCSSFPNGTVKEETLWLKCCVEHDIAYWKGGTYDERLQADYILEQCVASLGEPEIATVMLTGVRLGGSPFFPTTFRWGYGWRYPRFYGPLTQSEKAQVQAKTPRNLGVFVQGLIEKDEAQVTKRIF